MENKSGNRQKETAFGPIILIGIGIIWLLSNLDILPNIAWGSLWRFWPVLLILAGLNLILQQAPNRVRQLGGVLVGGIAVAVIAAALLFPSSISFVSSSVGGEPTINEPFNIALTDRTVQEALIRIDTGAIASQFSVGGDSADLLSGTVSYFGLLDLESSYSGNQVTAQLDVKNDRGWSIDWSQWDLQPWQIQLNPDVPSDLRLDFGSGSAELALQGAQLTNLDVDAGSGSVNAQLPDGFYNAKLDMASGASEWLLPRNGGGEYELDLASGATRLLLPAGIEARIELEEGSGRFSADSRFTLIEDNDGDQVWQTNGYESATNRLDIEIDQASGSVTIEAPTGR